MSLPHPSIVEPIFPSQKQNKRLRNKQHAIQTSSTLFKMSLQGSLPVIAYYACHTSSHIITCHQITSQKSLPAIPSIITCHFTRHHMSSPVIKCHLEMIITCQCKDPGRGGFKSASNENSQKHAQKGNNGRDDIVKKCLPRRKQIQNQLHYSERGSQNR